MTFQCYLASLCVRHTNLHLVTVLMMNSRFSARGTEVYGGIFSKLWVTVSKKLLLLFLDENQEAFF